MHGRILIVDDDTSMIEMLEGDLRRRGFTPHSASSAAEALSLLEKSEMDAVLADLNMPNMNGIELCRRLAEKKPDLPVVIMTGFGSLDTAIAAIRSGAYDFVTKPVDLDLLAIGLERAVRHREMTNQLHRLTESFEALHRFEQLLGESSVMQELFDQLSRIAATDTTLLISGESGTGKELVARAVHRQGARQGNPFVAINCATLPEMLLESELFGHRQGAFTDARNDRPGIFIQAEGGTLFLDEIGELPLPLQPKLLRALEEHRIRPVGGDLEIDFDTRIIAATNRDLEEEVRAGRFREDLYYRLNVIEITMPPLRARGSDRLLLANHFLQEFATRSGKAISGLTEPVARKFIEYDWPGNVRELKNTVERAVALTRHDQIVMEDLPDRLLKSPNTVPIPCHDLTEELISLETLERRYITLVLKHCDNNRAMAARILGLDRKTLYRKLQRFQGQ